VSSARIDASGNVYPLDRKVEPAEVFSEEDAKDPAKLARAVQRLLKAANEAARRFDPKTLDIEDVGVVSGTDLRIEHGFGGRVRWWIADWQPTTPGDAPLFERSTDTDNDALVLEVGNSGTVTVHVREAG
jgi:hypothetical protein